MFRSLSLSFPFYILRLLAVALEVLTLAFVSYFVHLLGVKLLGPIVPHQFMIFFEPATWIIGFGVAAFVIQYPYKIVKYYIKIAHIIYVTMITLEYKESLGDAFKQAFTNFKWLFISDLATKGIVAALKSLKDAILENDIVKKFKDPETSVMKFVVSMCTNGLAHIIDMTDELIVSYTWFTNDVLLTNLESRGKNPPSTTKHAKNQAKFMLEGMVFLVRTLPTLMLSTLIIEAAFIVVANILVILGSITIFVMSGFNFLILIACIMFNRVLIDLFYYVFVEPLRIVLYIYAFYNEMGKLEPVDFEAEISSIVGKVPLIGKIAKRAGMKIEPQGSEGEPLFSADFNSILRMNVESVAEAFNLNASDLMVEHAGYEEVNLDEEVEQIDEPLVEPRGQSEPTATEEPLADTTRSRQDENVPPPQPAPEDELEIELNPEPMIDPFAERAGDRPRRGRSVR